MPGWVPYQGYPQSYLVGPRCRCPRGVNWCVHCLRELAVWGAALKLAYLGLWLLTSTEFGRPITVLFRRLFRR